MGQDVFEIGARIDAIELVCPDQALHCGGAFAPAVRPGEQEVLAAKADAAQGVFGESVADLDTTVLAIQHDRIPLVERVI